ncbi:hypothetical protein [Halolamina salifodinae]|uniref:Uncharacterized protein n=1 Tax=Halolamina salifodinae TaxID=1202767 RepID=A0A8T4GW41_9EURY|nr:hypothetical protein [Halolamina salifodinae]MBP1985555.1 hypothetical protein [Halolamina salifodinae]
MTDPDAVARALARLAGGAPRNSEHNADDPPARVVADAEAAMKELDRAAAFVNGDGEGRLRRATQNAQEAGDDVVAARGQAVLSTLSAFRRAASGDEEPDHEPSSSYRTTSTPLAQRSSGEGA